MILERFRSVVMIATEIEEGSQDIGDYILRGRNPNIFAKRSPECKFGLLY
jgi:hypothetical protein